MKNIQNLQTSPEIAIKKNEKFYKAEITDTQTNEQSYVARPIFIVKNKKDEGLSVHPAYLAKFFEMSEKIVFLRHAAFGTVMRFVYQNGVYILKSDNDIKKILKNYIEKTGVYLVSVWAIEQALKIIDCGAEYLNHNLMNTNERFVNFKNGLLELKTLQLLPHNPEFLSTIQIPCDWLETQIDTPVFDKFLSDFTSGNTEKSRLLCEYMGAIFSNVKGSRFKKALFIVGKGDCGKSQISKLMANLIGEENASESSLQRITEKFGKSVIYMKRLIYSSELGHTKVEQMTLFKELTGGDTTSIEFKNCEPFDYNFNGMLMFSMNPPLPKFGGDKGEHVYNRMLIVECKNVIPKAKQNPHLLEQLYSEREGIIQKCIFALCEVLKNNYQFHIPNECEIKLDEYKTENSAVVEFWKECIELCENEEKHINTSGQVYKAFQIWAKNQGLHYIQSIQEFSAEIEQYLGSRWKWEIITHTKRGNYLINHKLNDYSKNIINTTQEVNKGHSPKKYDK